MPNINHTSYAILEVRTSKTTKWYFTNDRIVKYSFFSLSSFLNRFSVNLFINALAIRENVHWDFPINWKIEKGNEINRILKMNFIYDLLLKKHFQLKIPHNNYYSSTFDPHETQWNDFTFFWMNESNLWEKKGTELKRKIEREKKKNEEETK